MIDKVDATKPTLPHPQVIAIQQDRIPSTETHSIVAYRNPEHRADEKQNSAGRHHARARDLSSDTSHSARAGAGFLGSAANDLSKHSTVKRSSSWQDRYGHKRRSTRSESRMTRSGNLTQCYGSTSGYFWYRDSRAQHVSPFQ